MKQGFIHALLVIGLKWTLSYTWMVCQRQFTSDAIGFNEFLVIGITHKLCVGRAGPTFPVMF